MTKTDELLTRGDVAKLARVAPATVRIWEIAGKLVAAARTPSGMSLFRPGDAKAYIEARTKTRAEHEAA